MANGWDARDGSWEKVWQIPRTGSACLRREARPLHCGASTAYRWSGRRHSVHGDRRKITEEIPWHRLQYLQTDQTYLLHHDLRLCSFRALPSPQLQLHLWCFSCSCSHVLEVPIDLKKWNCWSKCEPNTITYLMFCDAVTLPLLGELPWIRAFRTMWSMATKPSPQQGLSSTFSVRWAKWLLPMLGTMWS